MPARRKPNALKILHGVRKNTINTSEPQLNGVPECPDWLPPLAKEEWCRVMSEFAHLNLVTAVDQAALAAYCQSFALWRQASAEVEVHGLLISEPLTSRYTGEVIGHRLKKNPAATVLQQERASMLAAGRLFGFDPSSRVAIVAPQEQPVIDPLANVDTNDFIFPGEESIN